MTDPATPSGRGWAALDSVVRGATGLALVLLLFGSGFALFDKAEASGPYKPLAAPARPVRLMVPSLHVSAPIMPIEVTAEGALDPPSNYREVGWWRRSARPGKASGQTVITGHTVHTGGGQMDNLGKIARNASIRIRTHRGTMWYRADRVAVYTKAELAAKAQQLFSQGRSDNRLVLITCTDWTGSEYTSNIVVFATPLGVRVPTKPPARQAAKPARAKTEAVASR